MRRFFLLLLSAAWLCGSPPRPFAGPAGVDRFIREAFGSPPAGNLADYADSVGEARSYATFADHARSILDGSSPAKYPPDLVSMELASLARSVLAKPYSLEWELAAHRARFHSLRAIAAVRYQLFKRGQRLAELVAATYQEKAAVAAWRELVTLAESRQHPSAAAWRADLKKYEASLKDLEEQCCPPDESLLQQPVWKPVPWKTTEKQIPKPAAL